MTDAALSASEISTLETEWQGYVPAQTALETLKQYDGDLDRALEAALVDEFGAQPTYAGESLWSVTKETLREELCGDEGFLGRVKDYLAEPKKATALMALAIYIAEQVALPISPSLAALIALYIAKVGLTIFCKYTEPERGGSV